jgi:SAM-dependent methyltransferase
LAGGLRRWLEHPLTRGLPLDDPRTTEQRRRIVREKPFLRRIYEDWYRMLARDVPSVRGAGAVEGAALELGSGAGFLSETGLIPGLVTSDVFPIAGVDRVIDARALPFIDGALRAILLTDVLHHISEPRRFLTEAARCVRPGGVITMIEPWVTPWSRLVYTRLHHEPFRPDAQAWEFPEAGPLSGANGALPWIMFRRDRALLERAFPAWRIARVRPFMPLRYLLSGGVSMRSLMPGWSHGFWRAAEGLMSPLARATAMFVHATLRRTDAPIGE